MADPLAGSRFVAVLRRRRYDDAAALVEALAGAGVTAVEFTFTGSDAAAAIAATKAAHPELAVGAGTVTSVDDLERAIAAGADFVAAPGFDPDVFARGQARTTMVPGALTPTEVMRCAKAGARLVKIFPAARFGPSYLRELTVLLPGVSFMPTGGIGIDDASDYLAAGAVAVGVGSALTGGIDDVPDLGVITARARRLSGDDRLMAPVPRSGR
ncbi:MAG: 2-dehydro-3-deoxyphosphogluconate aldolase / (4S)-4-hydroxy-2-oxoglutarate aldolase [Thermoleophilaceae bacterium]|jgi:2-dehydro-3-deoxyphosphogluconate aldolase/(4S)-4-hydroxy-2-oxoglutarate aldolase|nr:2-dehydro-3-deoxyphosphogluconate aldolase / (4S)-4-hydroxy-2-oxoglutarate aldolase [Thermoleophilaceae bacterium]